MLQLHADCQPVAAAICQCDEETLRDENSKVLVRVHLLILIGTLEHHIGNRVSFLC